MRTIRSVVCCMTLLLLLPGGSRHSSAAACAGHLLPAVNAVYPGPAAEDLDHPELREDVMHALHTGYSRDTVNSEVSPSECSCTRS